MNPDEMDEGFRQLAETLNRAIEAMNRLNSAILESQGEEYRGHGYPFGASNEALDVWIEYEQYTTQN